MAGKRAPSKPEVVDLRGQTGPQIAEMILNGEVSQAAAERFVAERQVRKLRSALERLQA